MIEKKSILKINNVYTAHAFEAKGRVFIGAGSETDPEVRLYDLTTGEIEKLPDCPGGMMSFLPVPGRPDSYVSIMGLFPPFIGREAGLYLHEYSSRGWKTTKAMDLPFAHRCEFIRMDGEVYLVAASVSRHKEDPPDWSQAGDLHIISMNRQHGLHWKSEVLTDRIIRNHGMTRSHIDGVDTLCISGAEGIFKISQDNEGLWALEPVFDREVSEMSFIDLDGDGSIELVTIEPFHGGTISMYKKREGKWNLVFSDSLSFGHGLSSGFFNGEPVVVVGNRTDSLALEMFTVGDLSKGLINRKVIETDAGPTQTQVFTCMESDYILSANQRKNEVALYSGSLE
jgi:hypothetical protein